MFLYEGHLEWRDVEPGVGGDRVSLLDHPDSEEHNAVDLADQLRHDLNLGFVTCAGPVSGTFRITAERIS